MTAPAAAIASRIEKGLARGAKRAGSGQTFSVTISRAGEPTGDPWNLVPGAAADHRFTALQETAETAQKEGMSLEAGERVYMLVNPVSAIAPDPSDQIAIAGTSWVVEEVKAMAPFGEAFAWLVSVRR